MESIGIIAGNRSLPLLFARQARTAGVQRIVAVAFEGGKFYKTAEIHYLLDTKKYQLVATPVAGKDKVTFEEILATFKLDQNAALARIGALIHALDGGDTQVAEAAGVQTLLQGAIRRSNGDEQLLAETEMTFDLLYEAYFEVPGNG